MPFRAFRLIAIYLVCFVVEISLAQAGDNRLVPSERDRFFETKVRPLLIASCVKCHGSDKQEGGLRLDQSHFIVKGGESGQALIGQTTKESLLLEAVRYEGLEMPPSGKLPDESIEILERWVAEGGHWPTHLEALSAESKAKRSFLDEERAYWFFQPLNAPDLNAPEWNHRSSDAVTTDVSSSARIQIDHPIDQMVRQRLIPIGLDIAPAADKRTLVRRAYLDLLGVVPSEDEAIEFLENDHPDAFARLVDQLLDDPRYGERWGRFWLDLVRFAESDGYKQDDFRPTAYRYRDYVIRAFNDDKPYAQFVREQLAGDELDPESLEMRDANGYLRLWIYEYNQRDVHGQWTAILNDITDVTGEAFLGLGYGCARCHDHKFDPLLQKDYYRLQAFFSGLIPREDIAAASKDEQEAHRLKQEQWQHVAGDLLKQLDEIERPHRERVIQSAIGKFPPEIRPALAKAREERSPREKQIAHLASLQQNRDVREIKWEKVLREPQKQQHAEILAKIAKLNDLRPAALPTSLTVTDVGRQAAEVYVPGKNDLGAIVPGVPSILDAEPLSIERPANLETSGRRLSLANWIVDPSNRLTWRVIVNRVWQHHFGAGLVENASDFGRLGQPPSHPELLEYLATQFIAKGGRFKELHRMMMNTAVYQQASYPSLMDRGLEVDPSNRWLWRFSPRRLDAEQIRDSMLALSGELDRSQGGPSVAAKDPRRSVYVRAMRNSQDRLLASFDAPDGSSSTAKRNATVTPLQSLLMMNSDWTLQRAQYMASHYLQLGGHDMQASVKAAFHSVYLRQPLDFEVEQAVQFLNSRSDTVPRHVESREQKTSWQDLFVDYCHVLLNSNAFLHVE